MHNELFHSLQLIQLPPSITIDQVAKKAGINQSKTFFEKIRFANFYSSNKTH